MQCHQESHSLKMFGDSIRFLISRPTHLFLFLFPRLSLCFGVAAALGELLMREGIVVLPQISDRFVYERGEEEQGTSLKEGKHEMPNIFSLRFRSHQGISVFCSRLLFFFPLHSSVRACACAKTLISIQIFFISLTSLSLPRLKTNQPSSFHSSCLAPSLRLRLLRSAGKAAFGRPCK